MWLTPLERLHEKAYIQSIEVLKGHLPTRISGLYYEDDYIKVITINNNISCTKEETCVMAEEIGHSIIGGGDLLLSDKLNYFTKRKLENKARGWGYNYLVPHQKLQKLIYAETPLNEIAEIFCVTEKYIKEAVEYYIFKGIISPF